MSPAIIKEENKKNILKGIRNKKRPLKRLLVVWDRKRSTDGPNAWYPHDDDDDDDDNDNFVFLSATKNVGRVPTIGPRTLPSLYFTVQQ